MRKKGKRFAWEGVLLLLTALFLLRLTGMERQLRPVEETPGLQVQTQVQVPKEELTPQVAPLDLNQASAEDLVRLPGIGEKLAQRILDYRAAHGAFQTAEELMEVRGIGEATFAELKEYITVGKGAEDEDLGGR